MEERYLTVSALTKYIKYKFDHDHNLDEVLLEGEISNFKRNARGHFYFSLKDDGACISAAMFANFASKVKFELKDGMKVFVKGNVSVYEPSGTYSINVKELKSDGVGDLYLAYEKLKAELEKKGFFDVAHKKPIPRFPNAIGVITSQSGAAVRDIINTVGRRYPFTKLILYPAIVQGDDAKLDIVKQIKKANMDNICDVLIVGRGGGSIEDLWAFNEEIVAKAIYDSEIPIISAVGHEIDFTIADFVADMRAATPTAAAELATPDRNVLVQNINYFVDAYTKKMKFIFNNSKMVLTQIDNRLDGYNPSNMLNHKHEMLDIYSKRLNDRIQSILDLKRNEFNMAKSRLELVNPLQIMDKGYSISSVDGKIVTDVTFVKDGDIMETKMKNGSIISKVIEVKENGK